MKRGTPALLLLAGIIGLLCGLSAAPLGAQASQAFFQVDLSRHVTKRLTDAMLNHTGNDLSDLDSGLTKENRVKTLQDVPFRIDGAILVGPGETEGELTGGKVTVARSVTGIPVERKAERLYFLHGTHFGSRMERAKIGAYVVHYADGMKTEIPIRDGVDVADWWDVGDTVSEA
jgi:hypothetical protein